MATRLWLGPSPGGHALRIMKNPAHDPQTTPRTEYDKFAFDSESGDLGYALGVNANAAAVSYIPMISSMASFEAGWWDMQSGFRNAPGGEGLFIQASSHRGTVSPPAAVSKMTAWRVNISSPMPTPIDTRYLLWQFHTENATLEHPNGVGSLSRFRQEGSQLRLPRPGYGVTDGNPNNYILHEGMRPAKVVAAGRFFLAASSTHTITLPTPVTATCFVGGQFSPNGAFVTLPFVKEDGYSGGDVEEYRCQFAFLSSTQIQFRERAGRPILVSYFVVAEDLAGTTSGSGPTLTSISGGHFQIRRPGASTSPNLSDIIVDSRWQTMPIVDHGFVAKAAFSAAYDDPSNVLDGRRTVSVSIPTLGYVPLVLVNWYMPFEWTGMEGATQYVVETSGGFGPPGGINTFSGYTCYTRVQDGLLTFVSYFDNPISYGGGAFRFWGGLTTPGQAWAAFIGVRYVVFAVPQG